MPGIFGIMGHTTQLSLSHSLIAESLTTPISKATGYMTAFHVLGEREQDMRHPGQPRTISETVHTAPFPVYGLTDHPLDLSVSSYGMGHSHLRQAISVSFLFTSPRYADPSPHNRYAAKSQNFQLTSIDAATQRPEREQMVFALEEPPEGQLFQSEAGWVLQEHHFSEEEYKQAGRPLRWEGTLSLAHTVFSGKVLHWRRPLHVSLFLLKSDETVLTGNAYGPSDQDLMQLLEGLQVLNHQDEWLRQYQHEFENPDTQTP